MPDRDRLPAGRQHRKYGKARRKSTATEHYRITVQDNGEPNQGIDTFAIKTDSYEAAGNVAHGNVQLHKQDLSALAT